MTHKEMISYGQKAERALKQAFVNLVRERRKTGGSLILWQDGKVVKVPANQIPNSALNWKTTIR